VIAVAVAGAIIGDKEGELQKRAEREIEGSVAQELGEAGDPT
jgi:hypothetical protein